MVHRTLFPRNHPKLRGRTNPSDKSISEPLSSMRLRKATTQSMSASVKRSTISVETSKIQLKERVKGPHLHR